MNEKLRIEYICKLCGVHAVEVEYRRSEEDVVKWVEGLQKAVGAHHAMGSCPSTECDLKIPVSKGADWIGGPPVH